METFHDTIQSESSSEEEAGDDDERFHSCDYCDKIVFNLDYDYEMSTEENEFMNIHLEATLDDFLEALEHGCEFAQNTIAWGAPTRTNSNSHWELCGHFQDHTIDHSFADGLTCLGFWNEETGTVEQLLWGSFGVCTPEGNLASEEVLTRPINKLPFAAASRLSMKCWFRECIERHSECRLVEPTFKPTRLIEISKDSHTWNLRLGSNPTKVVPYAALSYCWGPQGFIKTTKASLTHWMTDLPWALLPKTVQDAIVVTHELGLCFLWVDALCIVQDDEEEKPREISTMNRIFSEAEVTIAAARARHVYEGFLHPRRLSESLKFELPFRCQDGEMGTIHLVSPPGLFEAEPLDTRGWAMQEGLLSRRVLEFGTRQTRFVCKEDLTGHCDGWSLHSEFADGRYDRPVPRIKDNRADATVFDIVALNGLLKDWRSLVWRYTRRQLSFPSDRVLAISALAERYSREIRSQYLAGLWRVGLPNDLLWYSCSFTNKRLSCYQGPSWSWVSVNEVIDFIYFGGGYGTKFIYDLDIVDVMTELETELAPFGAMKSSSLVVRGRLQLAEWRKTSGRSYSDRVRLLSHAGEEDFLALRVYSDDKEIDGFGTDWSPVALLLVRGPQEDPTVALEYAGLLLRQSGLDVYTRLGTFSFEPLYDYREENHPETEEQWRARFPFQASWFDDCEVKTITLI